jgi:hypothetical protein
MIVSITIMQRLKKTEGSPKGRREASVTEGRREASALVNP